MESEMRDVGLLSSKSSPHFFISIYFEQQLRGKKIKFWSNMPFGGKQPKLSAHPEIKQLT